MARSVPEWIGKNDDAKLPDGVRRRIFDAQRNEDGIPICADCGKPIRPGDGVEFDHLIPLADGGKHRESNIRAVHRWPCHNLKTAREAHARAEERATTMAVYGLRERRPKMQGRGFDKAPPQHSATRPIRRKSEREATP